MTGSIEAIYIFNQHNNTILEHVYRSRPASASALLPIYLAYPEPRPALIYVPEVNPPTLLFSVVHAGVLFLSPSSTEIEPLLVLEFLHRTIDVLEDFLGTPLLASRIEGAYDVVAQLLTEMADAGAICNTEPNALKDAVEVPGLINKLLGGVGLPGSAPSLGGGTGNIAMKNQQWPPNGANTNSSLPWRRANVRHTSNELYVDMVESLSVTIAPSGRLLAAFAKGTIAFTSQISGVPDLTLTLSAPGGKMGIAKALELPTFHPCVRLARWREKPGELSFVPPDGRFVLAAYEVDLLPNPPTTLTSNTNLQLPASIDVRTSLGPTGSDFEVRFSASSTFASTSSSASAIGSRAGGFGSRLGTSSPALGGTSNQPLLEDVLVTVPISSNVRNITELRASRGEASFVPGESVVEWRIPNKDVLSMGSRGVATLRCTVVGPLSASDEEGDYGGRSDKRWPLNGYGNDYDEATAYQTAVQASESTSAEAKQESRDARKVQQNTSLMPRSATLSFNIRGWLASGIKVESLTIDTKKSRGLGEGLRPYKGVKYLTASRQGIEVRCD